jgi:hypothetical protein
MVVQTADFRHLNDFALCGSRKLKRPILQ